MQTSLRRGLATLATSALTLGVLAVSAPAQAAGTTDPQPARATAAWLVKNLNSQHLVEITSEYGTSTSYGTTIDLANALSAVGGHEATVSRIADAIAANLDSYAGEGADVYAGSTAKALDLFLRDGRGASDVVQRLEGTVTASGAARGRLVDVSQWGDYANTIGQAFAAKALSAAKSTRADDVTDFLLQQQCTDGFFRLDFARQPMDDKYYAAPDLTSDQSCDGAATAVDPAQGADTTALVAIQTAALAKGDPEVKAALTRAAAWLKKQQKADGSFVDPDNGANANTTGLAGWALAELGEDAAAAKAASWLRARQVVGACAPAALKSDAGAVAYDDLAWTNGAKWGLAEALDRSQWVMAGVQAVPALLAAPAATAKDTVSLPKFAQAGSTVTAKVQGLAAGEPACATGAVAKQLLGTGGTLSLALARAKAGTRTFAVSSAAGTVRASVTVLGKKKLTVKLAKKAKLGTKQTVTVKGLAAGEKVTLKVKGKKVSTGKASKKGTFTKKVKVGSKRGTVKVSVVGQYKNRTGSAKVKVK